MTRLDLRRWVAVILALCVLRAAPVQAEGAAAEVLIQQGLRLRREGKPEEALQKFRQAHELAPSPRTYGQMGLVEATLGRWTDSETHLAVALANPDDGWVRKNRAFLDQALGVCREHVGDLVITGPAGAEVLVGGSPAGTLPAVPALRVAEGPVEVTATAPGYEPFKQTVSIRAKNRTALKIAMTPVPAPVAEPTTKAPLPAALPPPPDTTPSRPYAEAPVEQSHWRGWTAAGLAVLGAGGLGLGITWIVIDGRCTGNEIQIGLTGSVKCSTGHGYDTKVAGYIATGLGAAALIAGGIVLLTGPSKNDTTVALVASPFSLGLAGRF